MKTDTGQKLRGIALAYLVVVSIFAGTVAVGVPTASAGNAVVDDPNAGEAVYVAEGGNSQVPVEDDEESPGTLVFTEGGPDQFGNGPVNIRLRTTDAALAFDSVGGATVNGGGSPTVTVEDDVVTIGVSGGQFQDGAIDSVALTGVELNVSAGVTRSELEWQFGQTALTADQVVNVERMSASLGNSGSTTAVKLGTGDENPSTSSVTLSAEGLVANGFQDGDGMFTVQIPEAAQDEFGFDTGTSPTVSVTGPDGARCTDDSNAFTDVTDGSAASAEVSGRNTISVALQNCQIDGGDEVTVDDVQFVAEGHTNAEKSPSFSHSLEVLYTPAGSNDVITLETAGEVEGNFPSVRLSEGSGTTLAPGVSGSPGNAGFSLLVKDDADAFDGEVGDSQIRVELTDDRVSFASTAASDYKVVPDGVHGAEAEVVSVTERTLVANVEVAPQDGKGLEIGRNDGDSASGAVDPLLFSVSPNSADYSVALDVTTSPVENSDADVVQRIDDAITVGSKPTVELAGNVEKDENVRLVGGRERVSNAEIGGDFRIVSQAPQDLRSGVGNTELTISLPTGVTFSETPTVESAALGVGNEDASLSAGNSALVVTLDSGGNSAAGDTITISDVAFDLEAGASFDPTALTLDVSRTGVGVQSGDTISLEQAEAQVSTSAVYDGQTKAGNARVGSTQSGDLTVTSATESGDAGIERGDPLPGVELGLAVDSTDLATAPELSATSVTTDTSGNAAFTISFGDVANADSGTATVTVAESGTNAGNSVSWTVVPSGVANQVVVSSVENALVGNGDLDPTAASTETQVAVFEVRIEDEFGRLVDGETDAVDVTPAVTSGNADIVGVYTERGEDGIAAGNALAGNAPLTYDPGADSTPGSLYVFVAGQAGDVELEVSGQTVGNSEFGPDTASVSIYELGDDSLRVSLDGVGDDGVVTTLYDGAATVELRDSGGTLVDVPRLSTTITQDGAGNVALGDTPVALNDGTGSISVTAQDAGNVQLTVETETPNGQTLTGNTEFVVEAPTLSVDVAGRTDAEDPAYLLEDGGMLLGDTLTVTVETEQDGSAEPVEGATVELSGGAISGNAEASVTTDADGKATVTLPDRDSVTVGNAELTVNKDGIDDSVTRTYEIVPGRVGNANSVPTDPDGDERFEDVNGDGEFDVVDADALFRNEADPNVRSAIRAFDFNMEDGFTLADVDALFEMLPEDTN